MKSTWLFAFTAYSYCQGTKDRYTSMRFLTFTLPCSEEEARSYLKRHLRESEIEYDIDSINCLNVNITNS